MCAIVKVTLDRVLCRDLQAPHCDTRTIPTETTTTKLRVCFTNKWLSNRPPPATCLRSANTCPKGCWGHRWAPGGRGCNRHRAQHIAATDACKWHFNDNLCKLRSTCVCECVYVVWEKTNRHTLEAKFAQSVCFKRWRSDMRLFWNAVLAGVQLRQAWNEQDKNYHQMGWSQSEC